MPWDRPDNLPASHPTSFLLLMMMMVLHAAVGRGVFGGEGRRGCRGLGRGEATSLGLQLPPAGHLRLLLPPEQGARPGRDPFLGMTLPALSHLLLEMGSHCLW